MKKLNIIALFITIGLFSSCYKEDSLVSKSSEFETRFEFPQGDNSWDKDLIEIAKTYNVYVIYDKFETNDFNRVWASLVSTLDYGSALQTDEQKIFNVNFLKNNIFKYLNPELTSGGMPTYFYLAYDMHSRTILGKSAKSWKFSGMDFYAMCLETAPATEDDGIYYKQKIRPKTESEFIIAKGILLHNIITGLVTRGKINLPTFFETDFDYVTQIKYSENAKGDKDYYLTRGFSDKISGNERFSMTYPTSIASVSKTQNFISYMHTAIFYTRDEIIEKYNAYPKILKYYDLTIKYLKDNYKWDIAKATEKPIID